MKEPNDLENQLRSWVPRHPSKKLDNRLFPRPRATAESPALWRLSWLAPASVSLALLALFLSQHNNPAIGSSNSGPIIAMILSNQSAAAYLPGNRHGEQNRLPDGYEWTLGPNPASNPNIMPLRQFSLHSGH